MRRKKGFTLIELMIVVAIIAIIMAFAIPSLANARKSANEASAISSLRTLATVCEQYHNRFGNYPAALADLGNNNYIDSVLASGTKSGYSFVYAQVDPDTEWTCSATPVSQGSSGDRHFRVDQSGVIEGSTDQGATWSPIDN